VIDGLKIIGSTKSGVYRNANGLLSVFGYYKGHKVKVYENFNSKQVELRMSINEDINLRRFFPKVIHQENNYVIEEFITGQKVTGSLIEKQVEDLVHKLREFSYHEMTWDYLKHIHTRVGLEYKPIDVPNYVNHNDLTRDNIIIQNGQIKVVDNEFLSCNNGWFMNVANSNILTNTDLNFGVDQSIVDRFWKIRKMYVKTN
jgi:hypothetical protein